MDWISKEWPDGVRSYLIGLTFGLVASPCSTPVLASLLVLDFHHQRPAVGKCLTVILYSRLCLALNFGWNLHRLNQKILELRQWSNWITPVSGALLVAFGVFSLLFRLIPAV
uniref:Cytochrome c biogenesis protein CcdA n=1 Tax=Desertifilum tharense IPPAS B-1220 TaxID=1781255 RepID=A0ACD5GQ02_9CYAN